MDRKKELEKIVGKDNELVVQLVDEIIFLENQLIELKKLPFISVNPKNSMQQKSTQAAKQYKEFLQQYTNCIKVLARVSGQDDKAEDSPLRKWVKERSERVADSKKEDMDTG